MAINYQFPTNYTNVLIDSTDFYNQTNTSLTPSGNGFIDAILELRGLGALTLSRLSTDERDGINAGDGMIIYNFDTHEFQGRANGAWINLSGGGGGVTSVAPIEPDRIVVYTDNTGNVISSTPELSLNRDVSGNIRIGFLASSIWAPITSNLEGILIGFNSSQLLTTPAENLRRCIYIGRNAGQGRFDDTLFSSPCSNIAIGDSALGGFNAFTGTAGYGANNVVIGDSAAANCSNTNTANAFNNNVVIGTNAGLSLGADNSNAAFNIVIGTNAANSLKRGSANILMGAFQFIGDVIMVNNTFVANNFTLSSPLSSDSVYGNNIVVGREVTFTGPVGGTAPAQIAQTLVFGNNVVVAFVDDGVSASQYGDVIVIGSDIAINVTNTTATASAIRRPLILGVNHNVAINTKTPETSLHIGNVDNLIGSSIAIQPAITLDAPANLADIPVIAGATSKLRLFCDTVDPILTILTNETAFPGTTGTVPTLSNGVTYGTATILTGNFSVVVATNAVKATSVILATHNNNALQNLIVGVGTIVPGVSFTIYIDVAALAPGAPIFWLLLN